MEPTCKHCHTSFEGIYCPQCGQKSIDRFSWRSIGGDILDALAFNRGFLFDLKELTLRPGQALAKYLGGVTRPYMNPVTYNMTGISLLFLSIQILAKQDQSALFSKAELMVYGFTLLFPLFFSLLLLGAGFFQRQYRILEGLICSLFLVGNLMILLVISRFSLTLINRLIPLPFTPFVFIFLAVSIGYTVATSASYLGFGLGKTIVRLAISSSAMVVVVFILLGASLAVFGNPETLGKHGKGSPGFEIGFEIGQVMALLFSF